MYVCICVCACYLFSLLLHFFLLFLLQILHILRVVLYVIQLNNVFNATAANYLQFSFSKITTAYNIHISLYFKYETMKKAKES